MVETGTMTGDRPKEMGMMENRVRNGGLIFVNFCVIIHRTKKK